MRSFRSRDRSALAARGRDVPPPLGAGTRPGRRAGRWSGGGAREGLSDQGSEGEQPLAGGGTLPQFVPQATAALGEPVGLGSACPVTCEDSLVLQRRLWDVVGARVSSAALARVGARCGTCWGSLGCLGRGARKELQTGKLEKHSHKTNNCTIFWWCVGGLEAGSSGPRQWWVSWCGSPESSSVLEGNQTRFSPPQILLQFMGSHRRRWCLAHGHYCCL